VPHTVGTLRVAGFEFPTGQLFEPEAMSKRLYTPRVALYAKSSEPKDAVLDTKIKVDSPPRVKGVRKDGAASALSL